MKIKKLEKNNKELREVIVLFESKEIRAFEKGKFTDVMRQVVMKLHELKTSTRSITPAIKIIIEGLCNLKVNRSPSHGTVNKMTYEAKFTALLHAGKA